MMMSEFRVGDNIVVGGRAGVITSYDPAFPKPYLVGFPNGDEMRVEAPADPPPASDDDFKRIEKIRHDLDVFDKISYIDTKYLLDALDEARKERDSFSQRMEAISQMRAAVAAQLTAQTDFINEWLDKMGVPREQDGEVLGIAERCGIARKQRDAAVTALRELIDYATENAIEDNYMAINQLVKIAKRGLNDDHE